MQNTRIFQSDRQQVANDLLSLFTKGPNLLELREHLHELHDVYIRQKIEAKEFSEEEYNSILGSYAFMMQLVNTVLQECYEVKTEKRCAA
jgi:hypothetical protein